jgi:hypothetical protein
MKKQLVILGILALLGTIGLSGCQQPSQETSISDILTHPNRYLNQTVTISGATYDTWIWAEDGSTMRIQILSDATKPTPFIQGADYKVTGIIRYGSITGSLMTYMEVTKIETT